MTSTPSSAVSFLPQTVDYAGFLRTKLRDLNGISTMAYELIQNADDVRDESGQPLTSRITFDFREDALVVSNDGEFRDRDFQRMQRIAGGEKRNEEGTTGNFGIGFISVYQISDEPEVISSGRRWRFLPSEPDERRRIEETIGLTTQGTTFRLPWAFQSGSKLRTVLQIQAVTPDAIDAYCDEVVKAITLASLFLKQLKVIEVFRNGRLVKRIERHLLSNNLLVLDEGEQEKEWLLFKESFDAQELQLKARYPQILAKRKSDVWIAIERSADSSGRLFATLPTESSIDPLPFHINADFAPASDRKRIIFESGPDSEWNRAAIAAAARALANNLTVLRRELVSHVELWKVLDAAVGVSKQVSAGKIDSAFALFKSELAVSIKKEPVIFTSAKEWVYAHDTRIPITEAEQQASAVFQGLGIHVPHTDLRGYFNTMRGDLLHIAPLKLSDIANALRTQGLTKVVPLSSAPLVLQELSNWTLLWAAIKAIQANSSGRGPDIRLDNMRDYAIALTVDRQACPPASMFRSNSASTKRIFSEEHWLITLSEAEFIHGLVTEFGISHAINQLQRRVADGSIQQDFNTESPNLNAIYGWLNDHKSELTAEHKQSLLALPIWQSSDGLKPLNDLYMPGDFVDPLGLSVLVSSTLAENCRELLHHIGAKILTFVTYASKQLPRALTRPDFSDEQRRSLVKLLALRLGELQGNNQIREILNTCHLIECEDGRFATANTVYLPTPDLKAVIPSARFAKEATNQPALVSLYQWLGVRDKPHPEDVIKRIRECISQAPTESSRRVIEVIFEYLVNAWGETVSNIPHLESSYAALKMLRWLPSNEDPTHWHVPNVLYAPFSAYLFSSQAHFLAVGADIQRKASKTNFLEYLNIRVDPSTDLIVKHILHCSRDNDFSLNPEVYTRLSQKANEPTIALLVKQPCLLIPTNDGKKFIRPDQAFWQSHPFGALRHQLGTEWQKYRSLLDQLGVREMPDTNDHIDCLLEIEQSFEQSKGILSESNYEQIVFGCWERLGDLWLSAGNNSADRDEMQTQLNRLSDHKVIPNAKKLLIAPKKTFIEDQQNGGDRFPSLKNEIVPRYDRAWQAMIAAGATPLSRAKLILVESEGAHDDKEVTTKLTDHHASLVRAVESNKISPKDLSDALSQLHVVRHDVLKVQYEIRTFKTFVSAPEQPNVVYDADEGVLHLSGRADESDWLSIARELARALSKTGEIGSLSSSISAVLGACSDAHAQEILTKLGFPPAATAIDPLISKPNTVAILPFANEATQIFTTKFDPRSSDQFGQFLLSQSPSGGELSATIGTNTLGNEVDEDAYKDGSGDEGVYVNHTHRQTSGAGYTDDVHVTPLSNDLNPTNPADSSATPRKRPNRPTERLRSYVQPERSEDYETDPQQAQRRQAVDIAGISRVMHYEQLRGRDPQKQDHFNKGFDILSCGAEERRYIEVKSLDKEWQASSPAGLSSAQFEFAQDKGAEFWLYVVEHARDDARFRIYIIRNPALRVTQFMFDDGWRAVVDDQFPYPQESGNDSSITLQSSNDEPSVSPNNHG
jgi:hypothetical protein